MGKEEVQRRNDGEEDEKVKRVKEHVLHGRTKARPIIIVTILLTLSRCG